MTSLPVISPKQTILVLVSELQKPVGFFSVLWYLFLKPPRRKKQTTLVLALFFYLA
jgi:hypothetical protein